MNDPTLIGPCADYEHDLLDLHDGALPPVRAGIVRDHLATLRAMPVVADGVLGARCPARWRAAAAAAVAGLR